MITLFSNISNYIVRMWETLFQVSLVYAEEMGFEPTIPFLVLTAYQAGAFTTQPLLKEISILSAKGVDSMFISAPIHSVLKVYLLLILHNICVDDTRSQTFVYIHYT
jgi:hypothetical protein